MFKENIIILAEDSILHVYIRNTLSFLQRIQFYVFKEHTIISAEDSFLRV